MANINCMALAELACKLGQKKVALVKPLCKATARLALKGTALDRSLILIILLLRANFVRVPKVLLVSTVLGVVVVVPTTTFVLCITRLP